LQLNVQNKEYVDWYGTGIPLIGIPVSSQWDPGLIPVGFPVKFSGGQSLGNLTFYVSVLVKQYPGLHTQ